MSSSLPAVRTGLLDLPSELILQIHLLALNPFFSQTHSLIYQTLHVPLNRFTATYLLSLYATYGPSDILVRSVRHPKCTIDVAKEIKWIWDCQRGFTPSLGQASKTSHQSRDRTDTHQEDNDEDDGLQTPITTAPPLSCAELPRRLFRHLPDRSQPIDPLLSYLFECYQPSANSHKGYPLCRAVLTQNYPLMTFLLARGADPGIKAGLAVQIAISLKDARAVKMLVERPPEEIGIEGEDDAGQKAGRERRRKKRRRLSDRLSVTPLLVECAMKKGAREIIQYFVEEKGIMPPLGSIMKLSEKEKTLYTSPSRLRSNQLFSK